MFVKCNTCGFLLSDKFEAYKYMVKKYLTSKYSEKFYTKYFDYMSIEDLDLSHIYQTLRIDKYCCRKTLLTYIDMRDLFNKII